MNEAQNALLARLRELVVETPTSGAVNAAKKPLHITRFGQAVERRAEDGSALVTYIRSKIHGKPTDGFDALVEAGRPDLTVEALVADPDSPWASEFTDEDREVAAGRLGTMVEATQVRKDAAQAEATAYDERIIEKANTLRVSEGKGPLSAEQRARMLARMAAERAR